MLKTLNSISQFILLLEYIEHSIYKLLLVVLGFLLVLGLLFKPNKLNQSPYIKTHN